MDENPLKQTLDVLENLEAGWVARRDAAESLGKIAYQSVNVLVNHLTDKDTDVQMAVERCLEPIHVILRTRSKSRRHYTLRDLALACEKKGARTVDTQDSGFVVAVKLRNGRSHQVFIMPHEARDGRKMVRVYTLCGVATPERMAWALKANTKLTHGAFALLRWQEEDYLSIMNNILKQEAFPDVIKRAVKEMAYYGDWLEEKMSGMDEF